MPIPQQSVALYFTCSPRACSNFLLISDQNIKAYHFVTGADFSHTRSQMTSSFRNIIPSDRFPVERGRYVLYVNYVCPWAHRSIIIHVLKKLQDIVELVEVDARHSVHGWSFSGQTGPSEDPIYGVKTLKEIYQKADPHYDGRVTVPLLWDKQHGNPALTLQPMAPV